MEEVYKQGPSKRAMASLRMLISWEIWRRGIPVSSGMLSPPLVT
jgi:hypothetical protein